MPRMRKVTLIFTKGKVIFLMRGAVCLRIMSESWIEGNGISSLLLIHAAKFSSTPGACTRQSGSEQGWINAKKAAVRNLLTGGGEEIPIHMMHALLLVGAASMKVHRFTGVNLPGVFTMRTPDDFSIESREYLKADQE